MTSIVSDRLERNLRALALRSPAAAASILAAQLPAGVRLFAAADGHLTGEDSRDCKAGVLPRLLASAHDPLAEAKAWCEAIDVKQAAVIAVRGAGVWHHLFMLADRMKRSGAIVVYEPDVQLLRLVLEHVDITPLLAAMPVSLVVDAHDMGQIASSLEGTEGMVASGLLIVDHPPSRPRIGVSREGDPRAGEQGRAAIFAQQLTAAVQAVRTIVVTTLVQIETTIENLLGNLPLYVDGPGIADLAGSERGKPAIIVSAGPSLRKNIDQLAQPGVRDRVVVIAVQTVLKQLLARGIKPHYVTALDYHPISTRFYEGLTSKDVEGVTLVIDPKAHPAIARAFPGCVRVARSELLDNVLGKALQREMGEVAAGATVAHLAYYLAKHLGCTTTILIGQDLGFTDNQYYAPGAAIHNVWSSELSDVQTLESLEWQRIVRMRALLRRVPSVDGGELYADEQMHTYRVQFEREFERDVRAGALVIDATQGGARKQHTQVLALASALREHASKTPRPTPPPPLAKPCTATPRVQALLTRLQTLAAAADAVALTCESAQETLTTLLTIQGSDALQTDALIAQAHAKAATTAGNPALWLVEHLNQTGQLKRFRSDRELLLTDDLSQLDVQRKQIERDLLNVRWLRDAGTRTAELLRWAHANLRAVSHNQPAIDRQRGESTIEESAATNAPPSRVYAFMHAHPQRSGLGVARRWQLADEHADNALVHTVRKLLNTTGLSGVIIAVERAHAAELRTLLQEAGIMLDAHSAAAAHVPTVHIVEHDEGHLLAQHRASVRAARCLQRHSWRGGAAQLCVYDEVLCPKVCSTLLHGAIKDALGENQPTALLLVGDDWLALDPAICTSLITRHKANPSRHRVVFCQAPPGLAGLVIDTELVHELAASNASAWWNTVGGVLGYQPMKPQMDAIAKDICVSIDASVRDTLLRCTGDDANFRRIVRTALHVDARALSNWNASQWCSFAATWLAIEGNAIPERVDIDAASLTDEDLPLLAHKLARLCEQQPALTLSLHAASGDTNWPALLDVARSAGVWAVHVRCSHQALTSAEGNDAGSFLSTLRESRIDVLSVDLPGDSEHHWPTPAARDACWEALQALLDSAKQRTAKGRLPSRWLAAHMPKNSNTMADMELFYDRWLLAAGTAVIEGEGQFSLPLPAHVIARQGWARTRLGARAAQRTSSAPTLTEQKRGPFDGLQASGLQSHDAASALEGAI